MAAAFAALGSALRGAGGAVRGGAALLLWAAAFAYGGFYFLTVPAAGLVAPVHFRFRTDCTPHGAELCSFPTANVSLLGPERQRALSPGQLYRVALELELPESPSNRRLGMFLVGLTWHTRAGGGTSSTRTAMLRYRSAVLRALEALLLSGLFLVGAAEQKQLLEVELNDAYREDPYAPTVAALLEIHSRRIEIYSARLRLHARFNGIRYVLYHFPVTSAIVGIATNFAFMAAIALLGCARGWGQSQPRSVPSQRRVPDSGATPDPTGEAEDIGVTEGDEEGMKGAEPEDPDDVTADANDDVSDDVTTGASDVTAVPPTSACAPRAAVAEPENKPRSENKRLRLLWDAWGGAEGFNGLPVPRWRRPPQYGCSRFQDGGARSQDGAPDSKMAAPSSIWLLPIPRWRSRF